MKRRVVQILAEDYNTEPGCLGDCGPCTTVRNTTQQRRTGWWLEHEGEVLALLIIALEVGLIMCFWSAVWGIPVMAVAFALGVWLIVESDRAYLATLWGSK